MVSPNRSGPVRISHEASTIVSLCGLFNIPKIYHRRLAICCRDYDNIWALIEELNFARPDWFLFSDSGALNILPYFVNLVQSGKLPNLVRFTQLDGLPVDQHSFQFFAARLLLPQLEYFDGSHSCWMASACIKNWSELNPEKLKTFRFIEEQIFDWRPELSRLMDGGFSLLTRLELHLNGSAICDIFQELARSKLPQLSALRIGEISSLQELDEVLGENNEHIIAATKHLSSLQELNLNFRTRVSPFSWSRRLFGDPAHWEQLGLAKLCHQMYGIPITAFKFCDLSVWFDLVRHQLLSKPERAEMHDYIWSYPERPYHPSVLHFHARELLLTMDVSEGWRPRQAARVIIEEELSWYVQKLSELMERVEAWDLYQFIIEYQVPALHNPISLLCAAIANAALQSHDENLVEIAMLHVKRCIERDPLNVPSVLFGPECTRVGQRLLLEPIEWRAQYLGMSRQVHSSCHESCRYGLSYPPAVNTVCKSQPLFQFMVQTQSIDSSDQQALFDAIFSSAELFPQKMILFTESNASFDLPPHILSSLELFECLASRIGNWEGALRGIFIKVLITHDDIKKIRRFVEVAAACTPLSQSLESTVTELIWEHIIMDAYSHLLPFDDLIPAVLEEFPQIPSLVIECLDEKYLLRDGQDPKVLQNIRRIFKTTPPTIAAKSNKVGESHRRCMIC
jgi:hypothetical protein